MSAARINEEIRVEKVRLITSDGTQLGIRPLEEALQIAAEEGLDLVEVAPTEKPPVCRIMDYGKYRYEQERKAKKARKKQSLIVVKEIKFRPKIDNHDFLVKKKHVERFLSGGAKVKVTIMFRGREMDHADLGKKILDRLAEEVSDLGTIESAAKIDRRDMIMVLAPVRKREAE